MDICWQGFINSNHSWGLTAQNICRELISLNHKVDMCSTNGINKIPKFFNDFLRNENQLKNHYDMQLSYTAMKNFNIYFNRGSKNKYGMWAVECISPLPNGFAKNHLYVDKVLSPSTFCKDIFVNSGVPEEKVFILPHGIGEEFFNNKEIYPLDKNKFNIFLNFGQPHRRKGLLETLCAVFKAFPNNKDVCLVVKAVIKKPEQPFELNWNDILSAAKQRCKSNISIKVISEFVPDISSVYRACNAVVSLSHCEGFGLVFLETLASKKIMIGSNCGGNMDFCNDNNMLLVSSKINRCPPNEQYWQSNINAKTFEPNIDEAIDKLRYAYNNEQKLLQQFEPEFVKIQQEYRWNKIVNKLLELNK